MLFYYIRDLAVLQFRMFKKTIFSILMRCVFDYTKIGNRWKHI